MPKTEPPPVKKGCLVCRVGPRQPPKGATGFWEILPVKKSYHKKNRKSMINYIIVIGALITYSVMITWGYVQLSRKVNVKPINYSIQIINEIKNLQQDIIQLKKEQIEYEQRINIIYQAILTDALVSIMKDRPNETQ